MKKEIATKYGKVILDEKHLRAVCGSRIYVLETDFTAAKDSLMPNGQKLRKDTKIERGSILVPHWLEFGKPEAKRTYHIFSHGLYEAVRGITHALFSYGIKSKEGELKEMQKIANQLVANICILMRGKNASHKEITTAQQNLQNIAGQLINAINEMKKEAREKIQKGATLKIERSGKEMTNIPATVLRLSAAERRIQKRVEEILIITPRLIFFEQMLISELNRIWFILEQLRKTVSEEHKRMRYTYTFLEKKVFCRRCDWLISRLKTIDAKPFYLTAKLIAKDLQTAKEQINKNQTAARNTLCRILFTVKSKEAQKFFERQILMPYAHWHELKALTPARTASIKDKIEKFMQQIIKTLDTDFANPLKKKVLQNLVIASAELRKTEPNFALAKKTMKLASNLL